MILHLVAHKKKQCYTLISFRWNLSIPHCRGNIVKICKLFCGIAPVNIENKSYVISFKREKLLLRGTF